jgi:hypothetical protein
MAALRSNSDSAQNLSPQTCHCLSGRVSARSPGTQYVIAVDPI